MIAFLGSTNILRNALLSNGSRLVKDILAGLTVGQTYTIVET